MGKENGGGTGGGGQGMYFESWESLRSSCVILPPRLSELLLRDGLEESRLIYKSSIFPANKWPALPSPWAFKGSMDLNQRKSFLGSLSASVDTFEGNGQPVVQAPSTFNVHRPVSYITPKAPLSSLHLRL